MTIAAMKKQPAPSASSGVLLIADISGYTIFLKESELEHAQGILSDLLAVRAVFPSVLPHMMAAVEGTLVMFKERVEAEATATV